MEITVSRICKLRMIPDDKTADLINKFVDGRVESEQGWKRR